MNNTHVVVMDNVSFHKGPATKQLIEKTGAVLLFLPPYSPDFNPIDHDFATIRSIREYNENETIDDIIKMYI
ncbi:MAG: transposase [Desulfobacula sp.]|nr:transposase [Desulfobacula sp.]